MLSVPARVLRTTTIARQPLVSGASCLALDSPPLGRSALQVVYAPSTLASKLYRGSVDSEHGVYAPVSAFQRDRRSTSDPAPSDWSRRVR
jgi:hypothetical protein